MKNMIKSVSIGLVSMLAVGGANAATVSVNPPVIDVIPGGSFSANVQAEFIDEGGMVQGGFQLTWDTNLLTLNEGLSGPSAANPVALVFIDSVDAVAGTLNYSFTNCDFFLGCSVQTDVNVYDLVFDVDPSIAADTPIGLGINFIADVWRDSNELEVPGVNYVGATVGVAPVPVPAAVWLFGSGLLGMVGVARRRSK